MSYKKIKFSQRPIILITFCIVVLLTLLTASLLVNTTISKKSKAATGNVQFLNTKPISNTTNIYDLYEMGFDLSTKYSVLDRFDSQKVDIEATIKLPNGQTETIPGFYKQDITPNWAIRYSPRIAGNYTYMVSVKDSTGTSLSSTFVFTATASSKAGFITNDTGARLKTSDGNAFIIDGTNAAWDEKILTVTDKTPPDLGDPNAGTLYDVTLSKQFDAMKSYNMNFARVWALSHWNTTSLEYKYDAWESGLHMTYQGIGNYYLNNASRTDQMFKNAKDRDIYVMWTMQTFGNFDFAWDKNPYNSANGGPCATRQCFEQNTTAKAYFKNYLRYNFARYGAYSSFGMAEYWNEGDKDGTTGPYSDGTTHIAWHKEMDDYWKSMDIYHHPTTTSYAWRDIYKDQGTQYPTWQSTPFLSVANQHLYLNTPNIVDIWISELNWEGHAVGTTGSVGDGGIKPKFEAEYGICNCEDKTSDDPNGYYYHDGAWTPFFYAEATGTNLIWHVDGTFVPHGITAQSYKSFGIFIAGELPFLKNMSFMTTQSINTNLKLGGYKSSNRAILMLKDWSANWKNTSPANISGTSYTLTGMNNGSYTIQYWDTTNGIFNQISATAINNTITLLIPAFKRDIAIKVILNTATPVATTTPIVSANCLCGTGDICSNSCTFASGNSNAGLSCNSEIGTPTPADKNKYCTREYRTKGDADGDGVINSLDYIYYVRAVNGGTVPGYINADFNGDGKISVTDRNIVIQNIQR